MAEHKAALKEQVHSVIDFITHERCLNEARTKRNIRDRVLEADAVATHLYNTYRNEMNLDQLKDMVREALREIRFNDGRGYYFATALDGVEQLFADRPEMSRNCSRLRTSR